MPSPGPAGKGVNWRGLLFLAALAVVGLGIMLHYGAPKDILTDMVKAGGDLHRLIADWGAVAAVLFVVGYAGLMMSLWFPAWPCTVAASFLFGYWHGVIYALAGATLGATVVFLLARSGLGALDRRAAPFVQRLEAGFRENAFNYVVALRLFPFVPFTIVNIVSAVAGVRLHTFVLGTMIGIVPGTLIYAMIGQALEELLRETGEIPDIWSRPAFYLPIVGLTVLAVAPVGYRYLVSRSCKK
ncbi:TVP38/TMEM64 family protein [Vineibacter terrae]|uniref:TVP38/TMEM64 family protein n=1 Tax=Vineibacter terrae TaxID=2586908 RepID=UPI002E359AE0|nr:TVP38/TMEM64 family protein [Vineibacter terrae]HEX2886969.1 TVP38/TMEM64 family protein [Vineibacter terrae]